jgi:hypothetical protein
MLLENNKLYNDRERELNIKTTIITSKTPINIKA